MSLDPPARMQHDTVNELDAYDNMGLSYYYLGDLNRSIFYHNRMMSGILEGGESDVRRWDVGLLEKDRAMKLYRESVQMRSMFADYRLAKERGLPYRFPHEDERERSKVSLKPVRRAAKDPLLSPGYRPPDVREDFMELAIRQAMAEGEIADYAKSADPNVDIGGEQLRQKELATRQSFYSNHKVIGIANKYVSRCETVD